MGGESINLSQITGCITGKHIVGPWMARHLKMVWTYENSETIGFVNRGEIVAGVWYEDTNSKSVMAHIVVKGWISRKFLWMIFDYPFNQLRVEKIICPVPENNERSISLAKKMGFVEECRLKKITSHGDLIFFTLTRNNCRFLGDRYGKR